MLWTAFILGLFGSLHCVGMCGPIALALPLDRSSTWTKTSGALLYNIGRISTYAILGLILGGIGQAFQVIGWQRWASIGAGALLLIYVLLVYVMKRTSLNFPRWNMAIARLKGLMGRQFKKHSSASLFSIGALNGLLPCGMVYFALIGAIGTGTSGLGAGYMALFGLGTAPALFLINLFGAEMSGRLRLNVNRAIPYVLAVFGVLFILRGMSLGIPFISPEILSSDVSTAGCH